MSLSGISDYFEARGRELDYKLHPDGFATDNIPNTVIDKAIHVSAVTFQAGSQNHLDVPISAPLTVRLYFKAFKEVNKVIKKASDAGMEYVLAVLDPSLKLTNAHFKSVVFDSINIEPYASSNDNLVVCRIEFRVIAYFGFC